jgi:hypothetical protein
MPLALFVVYRYSLYPPFDRKFCSCFIFDNYYLLVSQGRIKDKEQSGLRPEQLRQIEQMGAKDLPR